MSSAGERAGYKSNGKGRSAEGKGKGDTKEMPADDRKGERKGSEKGERKGGGKGDKGGKGKGDPKGDKGKGKREVKVVSTGLRGKVIKFVAGKPSGFIQRADGEKDVFFDLADVVEGEIEVEDFVEFDVVEGMDRKLYGSKVKKLPKDTDLKEEGQVLKSTSVHTASKAGSLTGGGLTLGPSKAAGRLSGPVSLRPGGTLAPFTGSSAKPKEETKPAEEPAQDLESCLWGRIVNVYGGFGFLKQLGNEADGQDIFFRAADVIGINCLEPGSASTECLEINLRTSSKKFYINLEDEVSFVMSKDLTGKPCAASVVKERKGAWRTNRGRRLPGVKEKKETIKDQVKRLTAMDTDQVLQNATLFKDILDSPEFEFSHLYKVITMLASKDLLEDTRSDRIYRLFLESNAMQACLRTTIIKQGAGRHHGNFLEECLKVMVEIVMRSAAPKELRGQLPLVELVEAWENSVRIGSSVARKGLSDDVITMLKCLEKTFPEEVSLGRVLGAKAPKKQRTVAEDAAEILEASHYQEMPILPTSAEMIGHCAFEVSENMQTYEKCADYIQTHFMLLREDYIEPLRAGIKLFMQGRHSPKDLHVYTGVKVVGVLSTWEGLVYRIELRREEIRKVSWDKSKQLMYGSLLCFSDDDFKSLIWATVWRRDPALISSKAQLDIRLPFDPWDDRLSPGKVFCCIENVTIYFEAYRHVLIALQNMRATDVPFQHTLLSQQPDPLPPTYLKEETDMFHFHNVFSSCEKADCEISAPKSFRILAEWPPALRQSLDLDPSQLDAVQHALTNQMALIQGPPGTGKTFVGLKIVQAILDNTKLLRHSPILVVCYTNHALDQFLEGIFKFCENIVRIGSRSKSEQMMRRNLKELVMSVPSSREFFQARKCLTERRDYLRDELSKAIVQVDSHTVSAAQAKSLMSEQQFEEFYQGFLDYLGDAKDDFPEDAWVVDDEIWSRVMKEWLGTSDPSRFAPVPKHQGGGLPSFKNFGLAEDSDDDDYAPYGSKDDGDEEEAANEIYERKLDVDNEQTEQVDEKRKSRMDFFQELNNAWLPYVDEYYETLTPEMRSLDWREENLWRLLPPQRRECYRQWLVEAHEEARGILPELAHLLERNAESRAALDRDRKLAVLREMQVVGMTTTAVSKYQQLLKELRPEVVIVEEAAEVLEAHILTALHPRTQHVVLIGDHQQLRPSTAVYRLSKNFHLDVSLFERLIHNGAAHVTLLQQRRMHPKISRLIKPLYPQLRDHSSTEKYPEIRGVAARCFFMSHFHLEDDEGESHSKQNTFEANFVSALCAHLVSSGYEESQITVLSPYLGQVRLLKRKIQRDPSTQGIAVTAVDNFQGEENDVIVVSLVRSNRARQMGFLAVDNRINVALTRARHGLFIIGNTDMLEKHTLWSQILRELKSDECLAETLPIVDKEQKGPFEVKSADEISVFLESKVHQSGGEGMITIDEYRKSQEVRKKKGQPRSRGDQPDRWLEHKDAPARGGGTRKSYAGQNAREVEAARLSEDFKPPARMQASEIYDECELLPGKAEQDDDAGKRSKKKKQQKPKQVLHVRG